MKLSRIDQIALNGATGAHYKYEEVARKITDYLHAGGIITDEYDSKEITKILVENFPDA